MLAVSGDETLKVTVRGVEWTVGIVPFGKILDLELARLAATQALPSGEPGEEFDSRLRWQQAAWKARAERMRVDVEVVRWGLRGTSAPAVVWETERESFAGAPYDVAKRALIERLARADVMLVRELSDAVLAHNHLSVSDVLGFPQPAP